MAGLRTRIAAALAVGAAALSVTASLVTGIVAAPHAAQAAAVTCTTGASPRLEVVQECFGRQAGPLWQTTNHIPWNNGNQGSATAGVFVSNGATAVPSAAASGGQWAMTINPTQDVRTVRATISSQAAGAGVTATVSAGATTVSYELVNNGSGQYVFKRNGVVQGAAFGTTAAGDQITLNVPSSGYATASATAGGASASFTEATLGNVGSVGIESSAATAAFSTFSAAAGNGDISNATWWTSQSQPSTAATINAQIIVPSAERLARVTIGAAPAGVPGGTLSGFTGATPTISLLTVNGTDISADYAAAYSGTALTLTAATAAKAGSHALNPGDVIQMRVSGLTTPATATGYQPAVGLWNYTTGGSAYLATGATANDAIGGRAVNQQYIGIANSTCLPLQKAGATTDHTPREGADAIDCFQRANAAGLTGDTGTPIGQVTWTTGAFSLTGNDLTPASAPATVVDTTVDLGTSPVWPATAGRQGVTVSGVLTKGGTSFAGEGLSVLSNGNSGAALNTIAVRLVGTQIEVDQITGGAVASTLAQFQYPIAAPAAGSSYTLGVNVIPSPVRYQSTTWSLDVTLNGYFAGHVNLGTLGYATTGYRFGFLASPTTPTASTYDDFDAGQLAVGDIRITAFSPTASGGGTVYGSADFASDGLITDLTLPTGLAATGGLGWIDGLPAGTFDTSTSRYTFTSPFYAVAGTRFSWKVTGVNPAANGPAQGTVDVNAYNSTLTPNVPYTASSSVSRPWVVDGADNLTASIGGFSSTVKTGSTGAVKLVGTFTSATQATRVVAQLPEGASGTPTVTTNTGITGTVTATLTSSQLVFTLGTPQALTSFTLTVTGLTTTSAANLNTIAIWSTTATGTVLDSASAPQLQTRSHFAATPTLTIDGSTNTTTADTNGTWTATLKPDAIGYISEIRIDLPAGTTGTPVLTAATGFSTSVTLALSGTSIVVDLDTPAPYSNGDSLTLTFTQLSPGTGAPTQPTVHTQDATGGNGWDLDTTSGGTAPTVNVQSTWAPTLTQTSTTYVNNQPASYTYTATIAPAMTLTSLTLTLPTGTDMTSWNATLTGLPGTWNTSATGTAITFTNPSPARSTANAALTITITGIKNTATGGSASTTLTGIQLGTQRLSTSSAITIIVPAITVTVPATAALGTGTADPATAPNPTADLSIQVASNVGYTLTVSATPLTTGSATLPAATADLTTSVAWPMNSSAFGLHILTSPGGVTTAPGPAAGYSGIPTSAATLAHRPDDSGVTDTYSLRLGAHIGWDTVPGTYQSTVTFTGTTNY